MPRALTELGRRERQIMDVIIRRGRATAAEVLEDLPDPPSYSSVRSMLKLLESKEYVTHEWDGPRHVYRPAEDPERIKQTAARHLLDTFFNNSMESAVAAMLGATKKRLSEDEMKRLERLIQQARRNGGRL